MAHLAQLGAASAAISNEPIFSGLVDEIIQCTRTLRMSRDAALRLSRHVGQLATVTEDPRAGTAQFHALLEDVQEQLSAIQRQGTVAQFVNLARNNGIIGALSERVQAAFDTTVVSLRLHTSELVGAGMQRADGAATLKAIETVSRSGSRASRPLLPAVPSLYFGRGAETECAADAVAERKHLAILGGPGMGKTSLAVAVLHHPRVVARFCGRRYFIACDAAEGQTDCLGVISGALGVSGNDTEAVRRAIKDVLSNGDVLLVLDNFESAWEHPQARGDAEETLAFLADGCGATIVVTLRGSERPQSVAWARPFLPPLHPLADSAANQLFVSIADQPTSETDTHLSVLLTQLDGVPLAIVLLASLAQYESLDALNRQWAALETSMLKRGTGLERHSSLDVSITLSLNSARMAQVPDAVCLLSLLSVLPSGAAQSDIELWGGSLSPRALPTLLQCSLASRRPDGRVHVLAPVRSFMLKYHRPAEEVAGAMLAHLFGLAEALHGKGQGPCPSEAISMLAPEIDNILSAIRHSFRTSGDIEPALRAAVRMVSLYCHTGLGSANLLSAALDVARSRGLKFMTAELLYHWGILSWNSSYPGDPQRLLQQARELYEEIGFINGTIDTTVHLCSFLSPHEALTQLHAMYELVVQRDDAVRAARCCQEIAFALERVGDKAQMRVMHERALTHYRSFPGNTGRGRQYAVSLCGLGECDLDAGDVASGMARLEEALDLFRVANHNTGVGDVEYLLGEAHLQRGDAEIALAHLKRAFSAYRESGAANDVRCLYEITKAHLALGDEASALDAIEMADGIVASDSEQSLYGRGWPLRARALLALAQGDMVLARATLSASRALSRGRDLRLQPEAMLFGEIQTLELLARVEQAEGNLGEARTLLLTVVAGYDRLGSSVMRVGALCALAEVMDDDIAVQLLSGLVLPLQRFGHRPKLAKALTLLSRVSFRRGENGQDHAEVRRYQRSSQLYREVNDKAGAHDAEKLVNDASVPV